MSFPLFVLAGMLFSFSSFLFLDPSSVDMPPHLRPDVYKRRRRCSITHIQQLATANTIMAIRPTVSWIFPTTYFFIEFIF